MHAIFENDIHMYLYYKILKKINKGILYSRHISYRSVESEKYLKQITLQGGGGIKNRCLELVKLSNGDFAQFIYYM